MQNALLLALFFPLISFLGIAFASDRIGRKQTGLIGCGSVLASLLCFLTLLFLHMQSHTHVHIFTLFNWIPIKGIDADFSLRLDSLSLLMAFIITGVGFLIHVFSIGYIDHEKDYARFFACLNFFVFAMLLLVLSANLTLLFAGWEGVGLASYLLIGYWYEKPSASSAATKAFVVNRIGDLGFLIGLLLAFHTFGTSDIEKMFEAAKDRFVSGDTTMILLTLLLFIGAIGKSAQVPLHVWLPDAMEGPTPVSALIHAATMVTAGVYLIVRLHPLYLLAPFTLNLIGAIGGITALFAALCALSQTDLKRVLAYSTVSQLGLMFLACGAGAFYAAMFHLTTHAFVKALLFLSAGNVVHMLHGTTELAKMGGLSKIFKKTHWLFLIGALALSGVPPLSAFFSKDMILEEEHLAGFDTLFYVGLLASCLTAFYMTRVYFLAFRGKPQMDKVELEQVKEAPRVMLIPVTVLALLSIAGGALGFCFCNAPYLANFLAESDIHIPENEFNIAFLYSFETLLSVFGAIFAIGMGVLFYTRLKELLGPPITLFRKAFFIDEIYDALFTQPLKMIAKTINSFFEPIIFEGGIKKVSEGAISMASELQKMQSGQIRSYIAWMAVGAVLLTGYLVFLRDVTHG